MKKITYLCKTIKGNLKDVLRNFRLSFTHFGGVKNDNGWYIILK
jgi:hypothetical protein